MKKGDIVMIVDGSYSKVVTSRGLENGYGDGKVLDIRTKQGTIIETGCEFPNRHKYQVCGRTFNNTIVVLDSGEIVLIEERFLKLVLPEHKIMIGVTVTRLGGIYGNIVEISDKLYQEIKRES